MLIDVVLGLIGVISLLYLLFLIRGNWTREKEKVDEFTNAWGNDNQPMWVAGNLRQRHAPEIPLPRPFIPSNSASTKIPPLPPEAQSDNTLSHSINHTEMPLPHLRRKSEPNIAPHYQYKQNQMKESSNLPSVPEYVQEVVPQPQVAQRPAEPVKPPTPLGGIRGTPPIRCLPINVSSLETLYPPPPPLEPLTAPRGSLSPNRKTSKHSNIDNPQISSTTSSSSSATSPIQPRGRSFSDTPFVTIDMKDLTLQHVLGGGAFGQVWQAMWKSTPVAVKVLSATCGNNANEEEIRAFTDEVQMLAHLRHPNICLFLGASLKPPNRFIVTELISRGSLWDALRKPNIFNVRLSFFFFNDSADEKHRSILLAMVGDSTSSR